jgi:starvation-inducible DNA-binding protein
LNNLADGLRVFLASNFVRYLRTHSAHWNVTGPNFYELHKLFELQYIDLWENTDTIAEKIRQLDQFVSLTPTDQIKLSVIESYQAPMEEYGYVDSLVKDHDRMIMLLNIIFKLAEVDNNQAVMNYLAERLDAHAKMRWFLKATVKNTP